MKRSLIGIMFAAQLFLSGCIILPVPHEQWLSPRFNGQIVDNETKLPLKGARVTLSNFHDGKKIIDEVSTISDASGRYTILATRHSNWIGIILGPADPFVDVAHVRFEFPGYQAKEIQKSWIVRGRPKFKINIFMEKEPNQSPEGTPMLVTPAADAPVAPSTGVPHL